MKTDILEQYVAARKALLHERAQLETRLQQINEALTGGLAAEAVTATPGPKVARRIKNPISMRAAVIQVTTGHPMTKPEILAAIRKLGLRSASKKPLQLLDNVVYGKNPRFRNDKGRFSPLRRAHAAFEFGRYPR